MLPNTNTPQSGFTIIELMLAISIGLVVLSGLLQIFAATFKTSRDNISATRLDQELQAILTLITREIQRSGYNVDYLNNPELNKYFFFSPRCIRYSYDSNLDGSISIAERYAFKFNASNKTIGFQERSTDCAKGRWNTLNDKNTLLITDLTFSQQSLPICINLINGSDCNLTPPSVDDLILKKYKIKTSIAGNMKNNHYSKTLSTTVVIHNAIVETMIN